ncbi:MAG: hypothetical protein CMJ46_16135 [Planctomyces sp.]|nr:hypothetical protein [Planctomyces sp.]
MIFTRANKDRSVNEQTTSSEKWTAYPDVGKYDVEALASMFGVSNDTITKWLDKYQVRSFKPGKKIIVEMADFWEKVKVI